MVRLEKFVKRLIGIDKNTKSHLHF